MDAKNDSSTKMSYFFLFSIGMTAVYDFLIEINEKDDDPLDDASNEVIDKLASMF